MDTLNKLRLMAGITISTPYTTPTVVEAAHSIADDHALTSDRDMMFIIVRDGTDQSEPAEIIYKSDGESLALQLIGMGGFGQNGFDVASKENWALYHENQMDQAIVDANKRLAKRGTNVVVTEQLEFVVPAALLEGERRIVGSYSEWKAALPDTIAYIDSMDTTTSIAFEKVNGSMERVGAYFHQSGYGTVPANEAPEAVTDVAPEAVTEAKAENATVWDTIEHKDAPVETDGEMKLPADVKRALTDKIKALKAEAAAHQKTKTDSVFFEDCATALDKLLAMLTTGTVSSFKDAQVFMSSLKGDMVQQVPEAVFDFITRGGKPLTLKDMFSTIKQQKNS